MEALRKFAGICLSVVGIIGIMQACWQVSQWSTIMLTLISIGTYMAGRWVFTYKATTQPVLFSQWNSAEGPTYRTMVPIKLCSAPGWRGGCVAGCDGTTHEIHGTAGNNNWSVTNHGVSTEVHVKDFSQKPNDDFEVVFVVGDTEVKIWRNGDFLLRHLDKPLAHVSIGI